MKKKIHNQIVLYFGNQKTNSVLDIISWMWK